MQKGINEKSNIPIWPVDFFVENDNLWLVHGKLNALFRFSLSGNQLYYEGSVQGIEAIKPDIYSNIIKRGNSIFLIPLNGDKIGIYDVIEHSMSSIELFEEMKGRMGYATGVITIDNKIYCIPLKGDNPIICVDTEKKEFFIENDFEGDIPDYFTTNTNGIVLAEGNIVFTISGRKEFLQIDFLKKKISIHGIPYEEVPIAQSVASANGMLYFLGYNSNRIYSFDKTSMDFVSSFGIHKENALIQSYGNRYLFIDSFEGDGAEIYDTATGEFCKFDYSRDKKKCPESYDYNVGLIRESEDGRVFYYNRINNEIIEMTSGRKWIPELRGIEKEKLSDCFIKLPKPRMLTEGVAYGLKEFLLTM